MSALGLTALFVDDEPNILRGYERALRRVIDMDTANSGSEALEHIKTKGPYAVIVSDMRMPNMTGLELLKQVQKLSPETIRIMLTGNADQQTAVDAINEGDVFRFLTKPCEPKVLATAVIQGFEQFKLLRAEKELLGQTLTGAVHALGEMLAMVSPAACGRIARLQRGIKELAERLAIPVDWHLQVLPTLSQLGACALPVETLQRIASGQALAEEERAIYARVPELGAKLVNAIPRLQDVAQSIRYQLKGYDGSGTPGDEVAGDAIPLGARLLRVACDYDSLTAAGALPRTAAERMREAAGVYDPNVIQALIAYADSLDNVQRRKVSVTALDDTMTLARDIHMKNGTLLMAQGQPVSENNRERLISFWRSGHIDEMVEVYLALEQAQPAA
jgi:response regulator RpfG family c-di-GMP phosphodiesterase